MSERTKKFEVDRRLPLGDQGLAFGILFTLTLQKNFDVPISNCVLKTLPVQYIPGELLMNDGSPYPFSVGDKIDKARVVVRTIWYDFVPRTFDNERGWIECDGKVVSNELAIAKIGNW